MPISKMKMPAFAALVTLAGLAACARLSHPAAPPKPLAQECASTARIWPSTPPPDCPFRPSPTLGGVGFTGLHAEYENADTWYPSWAADGDLYTPFADGVVQGLLACSWGKKPATGHARIIGDDPLKLQITEAGLTDGAPEPYGGRYPCGSLIHNGLWYYGTYCLTNENGSNDAIVQKDGRSINWGIMGPFVGFRVSRDGGKNWTETPHTPARPLFGEPAQFGGPVKIGAPHFVDFGQNMEHSPDGLAYLVAHGAAAPDPQPRVANASWINGDQIYLIRVKPTPETINDASQYEYYAGKDWLGRPRWSHKFSEIQPLLDWNNHCGCVTVTYNAPLKKYLMCMTDGWPTMETMDTTILEADRLTGPWRLVSHLADFGAQAYFVNIPSKFISPDGRTAWLCYSANFTNAFMGGKHPVQPPASGYKLCLQEIRLLAPSAQAESRER